MGNISGSTLTYTTSVGEITRILDNYSSDKSVALNSYGVTVMTLYDESPNNAPGGSYTNLMYNYYTVINWFHFIISNSFVYLSYSNIVWHLLFIYSTSS